MQIETVGGELFSKISAISIKKYADNIFRYTNKTIMLIIKNPCDDSKMLIYAVKHIFPDLGDPHDLILDEPKKK